MLRTGLIDFRAKEYLRTLKRIGLRMDEFIVQILGPDALIDYACWWSIVIIFGAILLLILLNNKFFVIWKMLKRTYHPEFQFPGTQDPIFP